MALSASQIASYGADTVDYTSATTVAQALGISPKQVTGDFNTVTTWVADGTYMVSRWGVKPLWRFIGIPVVGVRRHFPNPAIQRLLYSHFQYGD